MGILDIIDLLDGVDTVTNAADALDTIDTLSSATDTLDTLDALDTVSDSMDMLDSVDSFNDISDVVESSAALDLADSGDTIDAESNNDIATDGNIDQNSEYNPSFGQNPPNSGSDGYIPNGKITLTTVNGNTKTFDCYKKDGSLWVYEDNVWKRVSGSGTINIHNIIYKRKS